MPTYPATRNIQVKSKMTNTKINQQMQRPAPRTTRPVINMAPYHPAKQSKKRYKK